jgi:hypothetical protein
LSLPLPSLIRSATDAIARLAISSPPRNSQVISGVWVALRAVSLSRILPRPSLSASEILPTRHRLQVLRIDAVAHTAKMVDGQPFWNRADEMSIRKPVRVSRPLANIQEAVTANFSPGPQPARIREINLAYQANDGVGFRPQRNVRKCAPASVKSVVPFAQAATLSWSLTSIFATLRLHRNCPFGVTLPVVNAMRGLSARSIIST